MSQYTIISAAADIYQNYPTWSNFMASNYDLIRFISDTILQRNEIIAPDLYDIFAALKETPLDQVKVVIIGQDPYPTLLSNGKKRAQGLSFSVSREDVIPASLKNIYKVLERTIPDFKAPNHGDLREWTKQGVLLLNMALTCPINQPNGHGKYPIWSAFIKALLEEIQNVNPNCAYVLWGKEAQKIKSLIRSGRPKYFECGHPSPQSVNRGGDFLQNNHFNEINNYLIQTGKSPINWTLSP